VHMVRERIARIGIDICTPLREDVRASRSAFR
jgi:hypothetical protein